MTDELKVKKKVRGKSKEGNKTGRTKTRSKSKKKSKSPTKLSKTGTTKTKNPLKEKKLKPFVSVGGKKRKTVDTTVNSKARKKTVRKDSMNDKLVVKKKSKSTKPKKAKKKTFKTVDLDHTAMVTTNTFQTTVEHKQEEHDEPIILINRKPTVIEDDEEDIFKTPDKSEELKRLEFRAIKNTKRSRQSIDVRKSINEGESIEMALVSRRDSVRRSHSKSRFSENRMTKNNSVNYLPQKRNTEPQAQNTIFFENDVNSVRSNDDMPSPDFVSPKVERENKDFEFDIINMESQANFIDHSDEHDKKPDYLASPTFYNQDIGEQQKQKVDGIELNRISDKEDDLSGYSQNDSKKQENREEDEESQEDSNVFKTNPEKMNPDYIFGEHIETDRSDHNVDIPHNKEEESTKKPETDNKPKKRASILQTGRFN